jgi:peptide/nickel transport system permease protein
VLPSAIVTATTLLGPAILAEAARFPGIAIGPTVLGSNLLGDSLRDILDPRLRGSR